MCSLWGRKWIFFNFHSDKLKNSEIWKPRFELGPGHVIFAVYIMNCNWFFLRGLLFYLSFSDSQWCILIFVSVLSLIKWDTSKDWELVQKKKKIERKRSFFLENWEERHFHFFIQVWRPLILRTVYDRLILSRCWSGYSSRHES